MLSFIGPVGSEGGPVLPFFLSTVRAGFPSPAESYAEDRVDVGRFAVRNPSASYVLQVSGDSMRDAGIFEGDYVVLDRSLKAGQDDLVVAGIGGDFTLKRLGFECGKPVLFAANPAYPPIRCAEAEELVIYGVVCGLFRVFKP